MEVILVALPLPFARALINRKFSSIKAGTSGYKLASTIGADSANTESRLEDLLHGNSKQDTGSGWGCEGAENEESDGK